MRVHENFGAARRYLLDAGFVQVERDVFKHDVPHDRPQYAHVDKIEAYSPMVAIEIV